MWLASVSTVVYAVGVQATSSAMQRTNRAIGVRIKELTGLRLMLVVNLFIGIGTLWLLTLR